ncbi:MAG TPA: C25 family cysteine peptidase [Candidatus Eisenbacteria bacterium]
MRPTQRIAPLLAHPLAVLVALLGGLAPAGSARAQGTGDAIWIPFDAEPPGTPARVVLDAERSGPDQTIFDVFVSGFYVATRVGDDGRTYQDVSIPGLPSETAPGEPRVPVVRADLAIATDAPAASLTLASVLDLRTFAGYLVWPSPIPAQIHDGSPSQFVRDEATYASPADFPAGDGYGAAVRPALNGIPASLATAYPVHWNPTSGTLSVAAHARFGFGHGGGLATPMKLTIEHANVASMAFLNWAAIEPGVSIDWNQFHGAYLFVCPNAWMPDLKQLIAEKKTRGFAVSVVNVPLSGETCGQLRQAIQSWYAATPAGFDHYCLLVGSSGSTPYCFDSYGQLSDKVLSSVDGDGEPELYLGRLYVGSEAELQTQVQKILDYEIGPQVNQDGRALLVAHHQQDQDFNFASYQEAVRTASYAQVTPQFIACYGTNPVLGNVDVANAIAGGVGLVAYMGHGEPGGWLHWSYSDASFGYADAAALGNGSLTPVVWSIACQTADPRQAQSLAAGFMKNAQGGAVAFYGAVDPTYGSVVQVLNDSLFQAVYGRGITRHGLAIALAERATVAADSLFGFDAVYKYLLYGDPEMEIRRHNAGGVWSPVNVVAPPYLIAPCPGSDCCPACPGPTIDIQARDASGGPAAGVKIAVWKPRLGGDDEMLDNRYSGADGWVHLPASQLTGGTLYYGYDDGDGSAGLDSIEVQPAVSGVASGAGAPGPLRLTARPSVTGAGTRLSFGRALDVPATIRIFGVDGRLARSLRAPRGAAFLEWDGRDGLGRPVAAGVYLASLGLGATRSAARIVVVR